MTHLAKLNEEQKAVCEKILESVAEATSQEELQKNNNLFSRINDGVNKLRRVLEEQPYRSIFSEAFDLRFFKFYRLFMLDQDRKIREYAFESFQKILLVGEDVANNAKKEKLHLILSYSLGRD